tara:strand:- start:113 stop:373 length:261 start_codon:yes stop_codon:yes gene_type:complete
MNNQIKKYPFNDGDDYWTVENGVLECSCWDEVSEEIFDENPNRIYYYIEGNLIAMIKLDSRDKATDERTFMSQLVCAGTHQFRTNK